MIRRPIPHVITSVEGFVQYVAGSLIPRGYWYWQTGRIPPGKDPLRVDGKLIERYGCNASKWRRAQQKAHGIASTRYLRFDDTWWILATKGRGSFFEVENPRDCRRTPIRFAGYAVSFKPGGWLAPGVPDPKMRAHVRIDDRQFKELKAFFVEMSVRWSVERVEREFRDLPFEPFGPVVEQVVEIWRAVNRKRLWSCLPITSKACIRTWRKPVKPFG